MRLEARQGLFLQLKTVRVAKPDDTNLIRARRTSSSRRGHPTWSSSALGLEDNSRQVVLKWVPGEVLDGAKEGVEDGIGRSLLVSPNEGERALQPELLPIR